jgi:hypothetical protein
MYNSHLEGVLARAGVPFASQPLHHLVHPRHLGRYFKQGIVLEPDESRQLIRRDLPVVSARK